MDESIASYVLYCLGLFDNGLKASDAEGSGQLLPFNRYLQDEQTRFKVWSGNIGAHRKGASSLDYRLRDSSNIRHQVFSLLRDLVELLQDAAAIITDEEPPWDQLGDDAGIISSDSSEAVDDPDTELGQIAVEVRDVINCLLRLSVAMRNPAPHDRFFHSHSTDTSHFHKFDIQHVCEKFETIDPELSQRLGKAISRRRQFLKYRLEHRNKLSHGLQQQQREIETVASSLPGHLKDKGVASQSLQADATDDCFSDTALSQTSYATSMADFEQCRVPTLPKEASIGPFECPFCYTMIDVTNRPSWKKHVFADLQPYICLDKDSLTPDKAFSRRHQWMEHMKQSHWKIYSCPLACDLTFRSTSECEKHVTQSHKASGATKEMSAMIRLSQKPLGFQQSLPCPLCKEVITSAEQYKRHVGRHQEQLALFALPNLQSDNDSDPGDKNLEAESIRSMPNHQDISDNDDTDEDGQGSQQSIDITKSHNPEQKPSPPRSPDPSTILEHMQIQGKSSRDRSKRQASSCMECRRRKQRCSQGQPCTNCYRRYPTPICVYEVEPQ